MHNQDRELLDKILENIYHISTVRPALLCSPHFAVCHCYPVPLYCPLVLVEICVYLFVSVLGVKESLSKAQE